MTAPGDGGAWRPSRIRDVQAGVPHWGVVELIDVESGDVGALRPALEAFGLRVDRIPVGQARHLVHALSTGTRAPFVVLACHGEDGAIVLPELADEIERDQPFHGRVAPADLGTFARFDGAIVISTGCGTGREDLANAVLAAGASAYVAPTGAPFGYASVVAPVLLFYELTEQRSLEHAVERLRAHDAELAMWTLYR